MFDFDHYLDENWLTIVFGYSLIICVIGLLFEVIVCQKIIPKF